MGVIFYASHRHKSMVIESPNRADFPGLGTEVGFPHKHEGFAIRGSQISDSVAGKLYETAQRMSDTLQLVVALIKTQPDRNSSTNVRYASACRRSHQNSTWPEQLNECYLLSHCCRVEWRANDDKLKHIGHSLSSFNVASTYCLPPSAYWLLRSESNLCEQVTESSIRMKLGERRIDLEVH